MATAESCASCRSVILVGMRGAGKSSLGAAAAAALGWRFLDLDRVLEVAIGQSIADLVATQGMQSFRQQELTTLRNTLQNVPDRAIIACGGGVVETPDAVTLLEETYPVVHVSKPLEDCERALQEGTGRMQLPEPLSVLWERRSPLYDKCSDFEFCMCDGESDWDVTSRDFTGFIQRIISFRPALHLPIDSFVLTLAASDISETFPNLPEMSKGIDAVEVRVDFLKNDNHTFVKNQLARLRRATTLPIMYTVRNQRQGGNYNGNTDQYAELLVIGLRAACEYIDIEAAANLSSTENPLFGRRRVSHIIGSHSDLPRMPPLEECETLLRRCLLDGHADGVRLVVGTHRPEDCCALQQLACNMKLPVPYIVANVGTSGRMSLILNRILTPVTHPLLTYMGLPGELTAADIMDIRVQLGYTQRKMFYIFGSPVAMSPSPTIHNTCFEYNRSPNRYDRFETTEVKEAIVKLTSDACGGGSVTIPLKEVILPHMTILSDAAREIGAVNTVTVLPDGSLRGDNTDWLGIKRQFERKLRTFKPQPGAMTALVLGAGGTARAACYALRSMNCSPILIYNRTASRAESFVSEFGAVVVSDLGVHLKSLSRLDLIMGTVPAAATEEPPVPAEVLARFRPIVFDAAYRPRETGLLRSARANGCPTLEGLEMLFEQGCAQCELWTHRAAPRANVAAALIRDCCEAQGEEVPEGLSVEAAIAIQSSP